MAKLTFWTIVRDNPQLVTEFKAMKGSRIDAFNNIFKPHGYSIGYQDGKKRGRYYLKYNGIDVYALPSLDVLLSIMSQ
jgi:hypothetical protein